MIGWRNGGRQVLFFAALATLIPPPAYAQGKRPLTVDDLYNLREVRDPQRSPEGTWVAYTVTRAIKDTDKNDTDIWMVSWDGRQQVQLTSTPENESAPRWSPDGKYLAFLSSRQGAKNGQVWLLNRAGGEALKITDVKGGVGDYAWSPDASRLALVVNDPDPRDTDDDTEKEKKDAAPKTPRPIVVDRYQFKADIRGYLRGERSHLYLFDVAARKAERLTAAGFDDDAPAWSPDGTQIAFIREHGEGDGGKAPNKDLFAIEARAGAEARRLTADTAEETGRVAWSPDGRWIACLLGDELKWSAYDLSKLVLVPAAGGPPRVLTAALDRPVRSPYWSADGSAISVVVVDDRSQHVARVAVEIGKMEKLIAGQRVVSSISPGADGAAPVPCWPWRSPASARVAAGVAPATSPRRRPTAGR